MREKSQHNAVDEDIAVPWHRVGQSADCRVHTILISRIRPSLKMQEDEPRWLAWIRGGQISRRRKRQPSHHVLWQYIYTQCSGNCAICNAITIILIVDDIVIPHERCNTDRTVNSTAETIGKLQLNHRLDRHQWVRGDG